MLAVSGPSCSATSLIRSACSGRCVAQLGRDDLGDFFGQGLYFGSWNDRSKAGCPFQNCNDFRMEAVPPPFGLGGKAFAQRIGHAQGVRSNRRRARHAKEHMSLFWLMQRVIY